MTKIAFLCSPGLDSFIKPIVEGLSDDYETNLVVSNDLARITNAISTSDIIWIEWANELAIHVTTALPDFLKGKKVIIRLHSYEALAGFVPQIAWHRVNALICVADHIKDLVTSQWAIAQELGKFDVENFPVWTIPNGVDMQKFRFKERQRGYDLAYLGHINFKKGPMLLFHAFQRLVQSNNRYHLHIAGQFQEPRYQLYFQQMTKKLKLEKNITLYGHIDNPQKWLDDKQYIINSSVLEGHPVGITEAMAMGIKPVVHNFFGAETLYRKEHLWSTISQFVTIVKSDKYDSSSYKDYVISQNWTLKDQIRSIKLVIEDLTDKVKVPMKPSNELRVTDKLEPKKPERVSKTEKPNELSRVNSDSKPTKHIRATEDSEPIETTRVSTQMEPQKPERVMQQMKTKKPERVSTTLKPNHNKRTPADKAIQWLWDNSIHSDITNTLAVVVSHKNRIAYPEVTGYLIPTLREIGKTGLPEHYGENELARHYLDYITANQTSAGFFMAPRRSEGEKIGIVFDTAQALRGFNTYYPEMAGLEDSMRKTCDWLIEMADPITKMWPVPEGSSWNMGNRGTIPEYVHLYCLPPIMEAGEKLGRTDYSHFAHESANSYTAYMHKKGISLKDKNMLLHFFGYIVEALIDLGRNNAAHLLLGELTKDLGQDTYIPAYSNVTWTCSPGLAQMAVCYAKLDMMAIANDILDQLINNYQLSSGGFYGSYGIGADYFPTEEISWAVKFFLDAWNLIKGSQRNNEDQTDYTSQQKHEDQIEPTSHGKGENHTTDTSHTKCEDQDLSVSHSKDEPHAELTSPNESETHSLPASHAISETHSLPASQTFNENQTSITNLSPDGWAKSLSVGLTAEQIIQKIENRDYSEWTKFILDNTKPGQKVLELGSGTGEISGHLAYEGRDVTLLDFSKEMLDFSEEVFRSFGNAVIAPKFCHADVTKTLPFDQKAFDVVFSVGLLEHFDDEVIVDILRNATKVTDGKIISLVPNSLSTPYMMGKALQEQAGTWKWGKEDPKSTLHPHYMKAGIVLISETTIAPEHALRFVELGVAQLYFQWYETMTSEELAKRNQGYLLCAIGSPLRAINPPDASQKSTETHNNSTSHDLSKSQGIDASQFSIEAQKVHTNQKVDEDQMQSVSHPECEDQNRTTSRHSNETRSNETSHITEAALDTPTSQRGDEVQQSPTSYDTSETHFSPTIYKNKLGRLAVINHQAVSLYHKQGWSKERLSEYYNPGGIFKRVLIFAYDDRPWDISENIQVVNLDSNTVPTLKKFKPDIIRCYEVNEPFVDITLDLAKSLKIPSYLSLHDSRKHLKKEINDYTVITAYNEDLANSARKFLDRKVEYQPNGVDSDLFKMSQDKLIEDTYNADMKIFTIGRNDPVKNMDTMVEAINIFEDKTGIKACHILSGPGIETLGRVGTHYCMGPTSEQDIIHYLSWCSCFLQVQLVPELGVALQEALMVGRPIISSAKVDEGLGITIPEQFWKDPYYIAGVLESFMRQKRFYDPEKIRKWAIEHFDIEQTRVQEAKRYIRLSEEKSDEIKPIHIVDTNIKVVPLTKDYADDYDKIAFSSNDAWLYHTYNWQMLMKEAWHNPTDSLVIKQSGKILATLPLNIIPGSTILDSGFGHGGIAFNPEEFSEDDWKKKYSILELVMSSVSNILDEFHLKAFRVVLPVLASFSQLNKRYLYDKFGFQDMSGESYLINLEKFETYEDVLKTFSKTLRYDIRKAEKESIEIVEAHDDYAWVKDYYKLHVETYTRTGATPHPEAYFERIFHYLVRNKQAMWFFAIKDGEPIAVDNFSIFKNCAYYSTAASSQKGLDLGASKLLQGHAIKWAKEHDIRLVETGEALSSSKEGTKEHGIDFFKKKFGGTPMPYYRGAITREMI